MTCQKRQEPRERRPFPVRNMRNSNRRSNGSRIETDGYSGYNTVTKAIHVGCMAHLKRKFHDAVTALPNGKKTGAAVEGEAYCVKLFELEDAFKELSPEKRMEKRQELAKPILDEFLAWGSTRNAAKKSKLGEALTYLNNNGKDLRVP